MTIELLTGSAAESAASDADFSGTVNPRALRIGESLSTRAVNMLGEAFQNQWGADVRLAEAFSTSDFKLAATAELDKEMLAQYDELPSTWDQYTDTTTVRDFRPKRLQSRWRSTIGMARVPELTEYPADDRRGASEYAIQVAKYGRRFAISWEAWLNNEAIGELEDLPGELARQARETEMIAAVSNLLLVDPATNTASDVNTAFFKTANGNAPTALPLTRANLKTVLDGMAVKKDPNSKRVIARPDVVVVIPKALESQMLSIIRPIEVRTTVDGVEVIEGNELSGVSYVVEPMLDFVNTNSKAATTWFVVPKPRSTRPALWVAKLAGHEQPDLRVKADTGQRVGGGEISALEGSFEIDDIQYRGRHIVGNQQGDALFTYVSRGA
ncbi:hypothetical protein QWY28_13265 [Nocardioides sp. SOB77]|uniref:Bacteriophage Mu GpT domain-containing protein n=1 Tax=Nocardioides oceani TaxID=3058369 RepID=A0ABT8FH50_9ACTN|nr:hypothetical protein [Nocardioides oceani]MDN4173924.1 hypothetical protein [Nocardioides oceani]